MRRVAVFVDAGYFWVQACSLVLGARGARTDITLAYSKMREVFLKEVSDQFPDTNLLRIYWYDGPGPQGKTADHHAIDLLDDFKLRMGTRNGAGQQKAVDGLIIADMVSLTQSKAITDALLVTGDADLTPGVVAAQAMGLRVHLLTIGTSQATSPHLAAEVDRKVTWNQATVDSFAQRAVRQAAAPQAAAPQAAAPQAAAPQAAAPQAAAPQAAAPQAAAPQAPAPQAPAPQAPAPQAPAPQAPAPQAPAPQAPAPQAAAPQAAAAVQLDAATAAQTAHAAAQGGPHSALLAGLTKNSPLPREIDRELLSAARRQIGRTLSELEKRALRVEFKKLL